jgi:hypothetical protein
MKKCPVQAIAVESGVGCAQEIIQGALTGGVENREVLRDLTQIFRITIGLWKSILISIF